MALFLTRIELHSARTADDYTRLHQEMEIEGFERTITSDDGDTYHLPPAEYHYTGRVDRSAVLAKAKAAASRVANKYGVIVCEGGMTWYGLIKVK